MLSVIDGRWKGTILWRLSKSPMRTSELRRSIPDITERMLIRHLQRSGQRRHPHPPRETGTVTALRRLLNLRIRKGPLLPVLELICAWGRKHIEVRNTACAIR